MFNFNWILKIARELSNDFIFIWKWHESCTSAWWVAITYLTNWNTINLLFHTILLNYYLVNINKIKIFILLFFLLKNQIRKKIRIKIIIEIRVEIWFCRYEASFIQRSIIANSFNNIIDDLRNSKLFHSV